MKNMLDQGTGLTKRQLNGQKYIEYTKDLPRTLEGSREEGNRKLSLTGIAKDPPEVDFYETVQAYVVYFDLDTLILETLQNDLKINLIQFLPSGWTAKSIRLTSAAYSPPEIHEPYTRVFDIDPGNQDIIIGNFEATEDPEALDKMIKMLLWYILSARFSVEIGEPATKEAGETMAKMILERRAQLLECLDSIDENSAEKFKSIIEKPFSAE